MDQNNRYDRQIRLPYIDHAGQEKLGHAHVAIVGQGALGTAASSYLARAGVGHILIIDNDIVELSNLQRQTLFEEGDIGRSKADAACEHLRKINSDISVTSSRERLTEDNASALLGGADIVIDASDNFEARKIINDCCVPRGIPWIYGGVVQSQGMTMNIVPGGPCFACLMPGSVNGDRVLRAFFPVLFRQYWYVTAYFGMCLFIPFFNLLLNRLSKGQLRLLALSIVLVFSVLPTLRQKDVFLTDNGYSVLWLSCLYLLGGVLRLCGRQTSRRPASRGAIYAGCVLATWLVRLAGDRLWMARTGHLCDKVLLTAYTSPTVLLAAVALVLCFAALNIGPRFGRFIESVSPLAFSVYLIHAHPLIWEHWLAGRFAFLADKPPILLASDVLGGAFAIYLVCSLADVLRAGLFRLFRVKAFSRWAEEAVSAQLRPQLEKE